MENKVKKQCTGECKKLLRLNVANFYVSTKRASGYLSECKVCMRKKAREKRRKKWAESEERLCDNIEFGEFERACLKEEIARGRAERFSMWS